MSRFFVNNIDLDMAEVHQSKGFQYGVLSLLGIGFLTVCLSQFFNPVNTESMAPQSVLPLPKSKTVSKAGIDALEGSTDLVGKGRFSASDLDSRFKQIGYDLDPVLEGDVEVPRVFVRYLPYDLSRMTETEERKSIFFRTLLPLVLKVNEEIVENRKRVWRLRHRQTMGMVLQAKDRVWLDAIFARYKVKGRSFDRLLDKMDVVPASLALAQAAEESGWGTSRFAREGNALFGQWTFNPDDDGIVPTGRGEGKTHRIRSFDDLAGSLRAYVRNLNTHPAYAKLRGMRKQMRQNHEDFSGYKLALTLDKYSERGEEYITSIHAIMDANQLQRFDGATLDDTTIELPTSKPLI
jgi:Bax protein